MASRNYCGPHFLRFYSETILTLPPPFFLLFKCFRDIYLSLEWIYVFWASQVLKNDFRAMGMGMGMSMGMGMDMGNLEKTLRKGS